MPVRHPPEHDARLFHPLEPFPTAAPDLHMRSLERVALQRRDVLPDRNVDERARTDRPYRGRVARFILQPPDEPGSRVRQRIDAVEVRHELSHAGRFEWLTHRRDVEV